MKKVAKSWQTDALQGIRAALLKGGHRASLLQLPPGLGKTLIAIRLFRSLKLPYRQLIVAVPGDSWNHKKSWLDELKASKVPLEDAEADPSRVRSGTAAIVTHRQLFATLEGHGPRLPRKWLSDGYRTLIVVDEYHRSRRLKEALAHSFWSKDGSDLPIRLRRKNGGPPRYPLWLFLSATPYNPVRLDYDLDSRHHDSAPDSEGIEAEAQILRDEVRETLGALAWIDRKAGTREALEEYLDRLFRSLKDGDGATYPNIPALSIVPRNNASLRPRSPKGIRMKIPTTDTGGCLSMLWCIHEPLSGLNHVSHRVSTAERLVIGGVRSAAGKRNSLYGHEYSRSTMDAVSALRTAAMHKNAKAKLMAVSEVVNRIWVTNGEKIVIFCVHRAVASAVARHLRASLGLGKSVVADASQEYGAALEKHCRQFNKPSQVPGVLVTTDKLSESIDLHKACNVLIHYELPWSPLRIVQRFGRLWRIRTRRQKRPSRAPQVFHVIHPGSVEEEILNRLRRRWSHLGALGLDYLPIEYGLGTRVPKVPWR